MLFRESRVVSRKSQVKSPTLAHSARMGHPLHPSPTAPATHCTQQPLHPTTTVRHVARVDFLRNKVGRAIGVCARLN